MLSTFDNAEIVNRRQREREEHRRNLQTIANISSSSWEDAIPRSSFSSDPCELSPAATADSLMGEPLSKLPENENENETEFPSHRPSSSRIQKWTTVVLTLGILTVLLMVALLVAGVGDNREKSNNSGTAENGTVVDMTGRYQFFYAKILEWNLTATEILQDDTSAPALALRWLVEDTEGTMLPSNSSIDYLDAREERTLQLRFALATAYFSTFRSASPWVFSNNWLSKFPVCQWYGIGCESFTPQPNMVVALNLSANNLHGELPPELALVGSDCRVLDFSFNSIGGSIPREIGLYATNLEQIYLGPNRLTGSIPESLYDLSRLTHLYLDRCELTGTIAEAIGSFVDLQGFAVHDNFLTGSIPSTIGRLTGLRVFNVDYNALSGTIPGHIGNLVGLVDLRLSNNRFVGGIPDFSNLTILEIFYLAENRLTGPLDAVAFAKLPLLRDIQFHNNYLSGRIPDSIGSLALLEVLYLDGNRLTGNIPPSLGNDALLKSLYLFRNDLTGPIPTNLGELTELQHLRLQENELTGPVPAHLSGLDELEILLLNNNTLSGSVPYSLNNLLSSNLRIAHLHGNNLNGSFQGILCSGSFTRLEELTADCAEAPVICLCCTTCYV